MVVAWLAGASAATAQVVIEYKAFKPVAPPAAERVADWRARFTHRDDAVPGGRVRYRLLRPVSTERLPLVLVLHGSGAIGSDNESQMGAFAAAWADPALGPAIVIVPQASARTATYLPSEDGLLASQSAEPLESILLLVQRLAQDPGVDPDRISVVGFSMGASAAMQAVLARPQLFSAVAAFSAVPPPRSSAGFMPPIPLLMVHGDADTENPIGPDLAWIAALGRAGAAGRMTIYGGMDHRVPDDMLAANEWRTWLLEHKRR